MTWLCDLDGVVWRGDTPIAGAAAAIERLRREGERVVFVTNNSAATVNEYLAKLARHGVVAEPDDLITSAQAAAALVAQAQEWPDRVLACAGPGVVEALEAHGIDVVRSGPAEAVVVGWHRDFDFERLTAACQAVWGGGRLVGTNDDATYPTAGGLLPGGGAILAAVATATSVTPEVAGKPHAPMAHLVLRRAPNVSCVVGDRPETDGWFATRLGVPFFLVTSGVTRPDDEQGIAGAGAAAVAADLAALVDQRYP